jgi:hypothetical protein
MGPASRRAFLEGIGGLAGVLALSEAAAAQAERTAADDVFTPPGLTRDLPPEAGTFPRARFEQKAPFDLTKPADYQRAKQKVHGSLYGETTYLATMCRYVLCSPGKPAVPLINELEISTTYVEQPDPNGAPVQRAMISRVFIDAQTLEPRRELRNPATGALTRLPDQLFAVSVPMHLDADPTRPRAVGTVNESEPPPARFGDYIDFFGLAIRPGEGVHQPSMDTGAWRVLYAKLMDPKETTPLKAHYSFAALSRASLYGWTGYAKDDPTQILNTKTGLKVHRKSDIPEMFQRVLVAKYPTRF